MAKQRQYTDSWLQVEQELGGRLVVHGTAQEQRAAFDGMAQATAAHLPPPSKNLQVTDHDISGLRLRTYRSTAASEELLPIGIFAHGGGFLWGSLDSEDSFCRALAERVKTVIVSVDYRLSPEHKAPAQLEDMLAGFQWAYDNASMIKGDRNRVYTMGGSAGGTLTLAVTRKTLLGQTSLPKNVVKGVVSLVPLAIHYENVPKDYQSEYIAHTQNATGVPFIDAASVKDCVTFLGLDPNDKEYLVGNDPESHKLFPPTYIATCEFDPLRDDGKIIAEMLQKAGVPVNYKNYDGLPHAFWFLPMLPETKGFIKDTAEALEWVIGQMK
ncbi:Alpha/Beta hydrolase protein [Paraphoma chrysanthemicola]|nr:Alpha/Beta hydrolase protein [Paraphoma chrysanthemicola]